MPETDKLLLEIHAHVLHLPSLKNSIENQGKLLQELIGMREEVAGVNDSVKELVGTLKGLGGQLLRTLLVSFGSMIVVGCIIVIVAIAAITKINFIGEGAGFKGSFNQQHQEAK